MKMTYTILVEVSVDERSGPNLIDIARQHYLDTKAAGLTLNSETFQRRGSSAEEEIQTTLDAVGELAVRPDLLQAAGVQINWSSATTARVGDPGFPDADPADAVAAAAVPSWMRWKNPILGSICIGGPMATYLSCTPIAQSRLSCSLTNLARRQPRGWSSSISSSPTLS